MSQDIQFYPIDLRVYQGKPTSEKIFSIFFIGEKSQNITTKVFSATKERIFI